jgi:glycosyltransferase involved in cell wall biosynthesis
MGSATLMSFDATVLITSKNRRDDLRKAIASAIAQQGCAVEVLVIDDGSEDGTSEMVRHEFPGVRLERSEQSVGLIVQRNRGARLASANVVISIDDDAAFSTPSIVAQTLRDFDHPLIAAVAIPFVNILLTSAPAARPADASRRYLVESYIGTAHALKKEVFNKLGGYREHFVHQCEEEDFSIRLLAQGNFVRWGNADPIHHFVSPRRDSWRIVFYNARNHLLFGWHNVPMPFYPIYLLATTVNLLLYGLRERRIGWTIQGLWHGCIETIRSWRERRPVPCRIYRLSRKLKRSPGQLTLDEFIPRSGS